MNKEELHEIIKNEQPNICQIFCYKNGSEVYSDEWNNYQKGDNVHIASVTKSIMCLLIGIAIDKGFINSINDKVLKYFPNYIVKRGEKTIYDVTIKHLLTMKAPYKCKGDPWTKVCSSSDWTKASLDLLGGRNGLTNDFKYQTVCLHILSGILFAATNLKTVDFANKYLFDPLDISNHSGYFVNTVEKHKGFIMDKSPKKDYWFCDPQGIGTPGYGLCLSAQDLAKIGLLCLNNGVYNNKQVVSSAWIKLISTPTCDCGERFGNMSYGYLWWIINKEKNIYAAIGDSGNVIYVNSNANLVIGITAYFKPAILDRIDFIQKTIEPFVLRQSNNS